MRCDGCGRYTRADGLARQRYTQADYLFGGDPIWLCRNCAPTPEEK